MLLFDLLQPFGYRTAIISSQNESWGGMSNFLATPALDTIVDARSYRGPTYVPRTDEGFAAFAQLGKRSGKIDDRYTIAEAIRWIDLDPARPFALYVNLQRSHVPYELPPDFRRPFGHRPSFGIGFNHFPRDSAAVVRNAYSSSLSYIDAQLERLLARLQQLGLEQRTLIVLTGDHGQAFYEHGFTAHANQLFDELLRTPLIFAGPGVAAAVDSFPAQHIDILPTVLGLLGLPPHPGLAGTALGAAVRPWERPQFAVVQTPLAEQYAVARGGYKLIYDARSNRELLFDLLCDPGERVDRVLAEPGVRQVLRRELNVWWGRQLRYHADPLAMRTAYPPPPTATGRPLPLERTGECDGAGGVGK